MPFILNVIYARTLHQLRNKQMNHVLKDIYPQENSRTYIGVLKRVKMHLPQRLVVVQTKNTMQVEHQMQLKEIGNEILRITWGESSVLVCSKLL